MDVFTVCKFNLVFDNSHCYKPTFRSFLCCALLLLFFSFLSFFLFFSFFFFKPEFELDVGCSRHEKKIFAVHSQDVFITTLVML